MDLSSAQIAVIGLGYVGLPLAVEFGKQRPVLGFDIHTARIAELQAGRDSTLEVESQDLAAASPEEVCGPVLEMASGLKFKQDLSCGYSPVRINPDDKQHRLPSIKNVTNGSTPEVVLAAIRCRLGINVLGVIKAIGVKGKVALFRPDMVVEHLRWLTELRPHLG